MKTLDTYKQKHGLSDEQLAERLGISVHYVRKIRYGKRVPSRTTATKISAATNGEVAVTELLFPEGLPSEAKMTTSATA